VAVERDLQADFREWNSWHQHMTQQITRFPGVATEVRPPVCGEPFPTLSISWDPEKIGLTAGDVVRRLVESKRRIMSHAEGQGHAFLIRPAARKPGEDEIALQRLYEIFPFAPKSGPPKPLAARMAALPGSWDAEYAVCSARHLVLIAADCNDPAGSHQGWTHKGALRGRIDGKWLEFRSVLSAEGNRLSHTFRGEIGDGLIPGTLDLGDSEGQWRARRHA